MGKSGEKRGKVGKSGISGEKCEKWRIVGKSGKSVFFYLGQNGRWRPFWMSENNFRSQFLPFQIDAQFFFLEIFGQNGGHFGLDDNVSYRTRPRYLDE